MNRRRFIVLLVAALLVITGGLYLSARRNMSPDAQGALLLPTFTAQMNTVSALSVRKGGTAPSVTVHQSTGKWTVLERGDYPADVAKLRKLLLALGEARIVEQKTSNPANFPVIGVEDPAQPGATGAEITVTAQDGKHAVIVGKPIGEGNFARRSGENTSYVVEPAITFETEPRYWIETRLIDVPAASIQSIEVKPASGAGYVIRRLKPNEDGFGLEGTPAGILLVMHPGRSNVVVCRLTAQITQVPVRPLRGQFLLPAPCLAGSRPGDGAGLDRTDRLVAAAQSVFEGWHRISNLFATEALRRAGICIADGAGRDCTDRPVVAPARTVFERWHRI